MWGVRAAWHVQSDRLLTYTLNKIVKVFQVALFLSLGLLIFHARLLEVETNIDGLIQRLLPPEQEPLKE